VIKALSSIILNLMLVSLILLGGVSSFAQQAEDPESPAEVPEKEANPVKTTPVKKSKSETKAKNKDDKPPDIFVPSEEISEDLSVSFPEDI